jgi:hypothetical protein
MPNSAPIFISYRRKDSQVFTDRIYERLAAHFGAAAVFRDIQSIQYGEKFPDRLQTAVETCQVMIAVIGDIWATIADEEGHPRLSNPEDWVRREIEVALSRGIDLIPALLETTHLPSDDQLPPTLQPLRQHNTIQIRSGLDFDVDIERLIQRLEAIVGTPRSGQSTLQSSQSEPVRRGGRLRLNGAQREQLQEALKMAFPEPSQLERMLESKLDMPLNEFAGTGSYPDTLFRLVKGINARGKVEDLLSNALEVSEFSPELQELADLWLKE